jgi:hypothetical protein
LDFVGDGVGGEDVGGGRELKGSAEGSRESGVEGGGGDGKGEGGAVEELAAEVVDVDGDRFAGAEKRMGKSDVEAAEVWCPRGVALVV